MQLPDKVKIKPEDAERIKEIGQKQQDLGAFLDTVMNQGQNRMAQYRALVSDFWKDAEKEYGLDLDNIEYTLDKAGEHIIPVALKRLED
jgi:hypothetical protein